MEELDRLLLLELLDDGRLQEAPCAEKRSATTPASAGLTPASHHLEGRTRVLQPL